MDSIDNGDASKRKEFTYYYPAKRDDSNTSLEDYEHRFDTEERCSEWIKNNIYRYETLDSEKRKWYAKKKII